MATIQKVNANLSPDVNLMELVWLPQGQRKTCRYHNCGTCRFLDRKIGLDPKIEPLQKQCCFFDVSLV